ncbi:uncharacterized protein SPAPADRAFT_61516, partial [Spathaspora passalidarum NRRL Y-27907]
MAQFGGFKESFLKSSDVNNSDTVSGSDSSSPASNEQQQQQSSSSQGGIPTIAVKQENIDHLLSSPGNSLDIKKQLSQSLQGIGGSHNTGGISKPRSRRNSAIIKSNQGSDNEDDKFDQGNERKRRDNINEKIQELSTLIPAEFFQDTTKAGSPDVTKEGSEGMGDTEEDVNNAVKIAGTKDGKPNKGQILTKSVEYLQYLQSLIDENNRKEVELILKLRTLELKKNNHSSDVPIRIGYTSAERALGEIGVGPCSEEYFRNVLV